jgi:hypothetical protein
LCHERLATLIELAKAPKVDLTPENITLLQHMMDIAVDAQEDCPVYPSEKNGNNRFVWMSSRIIQRE